MSKLPSLADVAAQNSGDYVMEIRVKDPNTNLNRYFQNDKLEELKEDIMCLTTGNKFVITIKEDN